MSKLGNLSPAKSILVTDAGSNYYIGGQVWKFNKKQKELTSISNAAMGLTIPLSIGAAVASSSKEILAVTGDGSLELNIQELKTISHYKLNVKLFVINNGGYVSMHNWADTFFKGRRLDTPEDTGDGTLNLKKIANAFDLKHYLIKDTKNINKDIKNILKIKGPLFIEVITDHNQKIFDAFKDY
jgi:acetolactate synthase-1/2/3 large subunit